MATVTILPPGTVATGASLPQNVEAEAALLGAMLIDNRLADDLL
ncbi:MAG: DnaB-like helicase N-terminal domain-containing protein, partial [Sphingomonas sp.]